MTEDNVVLKLFNELNQKVNEIKEIYATLQTLKKYGADIDLPSIESLLNCKVESLPTSLTIRGDEFYGISNNEAAERYLRKVGHAMSLEEIFQALVDGGMQFSGDGKKNLNIQMTRATRKFAKIGQGRGVKFGLLEWYPKRKKPAKIKGENGETDQEDSSEINDIDFAEFDPKENKIDLGSENT